MEEWSEISRQMAFENKAKRFFNNLVTVATISILIILFLWLTLVASVARSEEITLKVFPEVQIWSAESVIRATMLIEPAAQNHCLKLSYRFTYPGGGGTSTWEIDETSPRQHIRTIKYATPGRVWVTVDLHRIVEGKDKHVTREQVARLRWGDEDDESP